MPKTFGIPITKGKLLSKGKHGVIVSFNLRHLLVDRLLKAQLFSANRRPLTEVIVPTVRIPDIFSCPSLASSPVFAFSQRGYTAIIFVKVPTFRFSGNTRVVFWFTRTGIPVKSVEDRLDVPAQNMALLKASILRETYITSGQPVPEEIEQTVRDGEARIRREGNPQNYYHADTFNLSAQEIDQLADEESGELPVWSQTKKEFCHHILAEYEAHKDQYKSRRDAAFRIFKRYRFSDGGWTAKKCYELLKQIPK